MTCISKTEEESIFKGEFECHLLHEVSPAIICSHAQLDLTSYKMICATNLNLQSYSVEGKGGTVTHVFVKQV